MGQGRERLFGSRNLYANTRRGGGGQRRRPIQPGSPGLSRWPGLYAAEPLEQRLLLAVLYVDLNAAGPIHDGSSWDSAYADLQPALINAQAGDEIRIAAGTYKPTIDTDRTKSFQLKNAVAIYGGYAGHNAPDPDQRDVQRYPTILSGDIGTPGDSSDNSYHVLIANGVGPSTVLDGVTVTGANAHGTYAHEASGGGLYATGSSLTLNNCSFTGNSAYLEGGGMYNISSSPTLTNCTFGGNSASYHGGGMYNYSSAPTLTNCIIWGNSSGAIYNGSKSTSKVTFSDIQGGYPGTGNIDADPRFVRTPWTGPDGRWATADDDYGDLRLRAGSPCIDQGNNAAIPTAITTDLAANPRIQNGTVDMGIYEGTTAAPTPKTLYVDAAAAGTNTGSSWANAFTSLQSALQAAADGDTIRIADGIYKPSSSNDRTTSFALRNAVGLYGGYAGYGASNPDARDMTLYLTILSGDIGTPGDSSDNSYHVLTASGVGPSTVLDGVTVTGGNANGSDPNQSSGGGLYTTVSSPTLTNCSFSGNSAIGGGGGMYNSSYSSPTLTNCSFSGNSASNCGGGMCNYSSSLTLTNCSFSGNSASGIFGGGGMYNYSSSSPTLTNCSFSGNSASYYGGGMSNDHSSPKLANCSFSGNSAIYGGGMYNSFSSSPTLTNCSISGNSASYYAGGGGMCNNDYSSPTLTNCIVWGNSSAISNSSGSTPKVTYTLIQGGYPGLANLNADPLFVRNPSPGLDGKWGTVDDDYGDLRLQPTSPGINAGSNAALSSGLGADLEGNPRVVNGTVDLGAYEYQGDEIALAGSEGPDRFYLRRASGGGVEIYSGSGPEGQAIQVIDPSRLSFTRLSLRGGDGDDCFILDFSQGDPLPGLGLSVSGGRGENRVVLVGSSAADSFAISEGQVLWGTEKVTLGEVQQIELDGRGGGDGLSVSGSVPVRLRGGQQLASLSLGEDGMVDLGDNELIVTATAETQAAVLAAVSRAIKNARGIDGNWEGKGLSSSEARGDQQRGLAVMLNERDGRLVFDKFAGQAVSENDILVKYTWNGDVNLDGVVDGDDYFSVDSGFISRAEGYCNGDLNFDGVVDGDDYFLIDSAFIGQGGVMDATEVRATGDDVVMLKAEMSRPGRVASVIEQLFSTRAVVVA